MEGEGEPTEITRIKTDLRVVAADSINVSTWLAQAMEKSWSATTACSHTRRSPICSVTTTGSSPTSGRPPP